ncbi:tetratricopeptide repeat protein [Flavobacterium urocaniciphilum]|uniref:Tetratricopeptide repeat-containing protein n=1 Tax=Flavobacterium urocaniciphilum TaxID=1299341 RepID=A0A1H8Z1C9_9FLAO|nr:hypothetical protein [Flavobacterium urocaniciphilum]SEP58244.1 Tetratricopeptide repeat-containing protein [Flavobacterium urocaniciphilum]
MKKYFLIVVLLIVGSSFSQNKKFEELFNNGMSHYNKKDLDKAIVAFEKAKKQDSLNDKTYRYLGFCYEKKFEIEKTIENYEKAIVLNKENGDLLLNLGLNYKFSRKFDKAIECYLKYIDFNSESEQGYVCAAITYSKLDNYIESNKYALIALEKAKTTNPNLVLDIKFTLAYNYYFLEEKKLAKDLFEELIKNNYDISNDDILNDLGLKK